jgi:hypothetical protein
MMSSRHEKEDNIADLALWAVIFFGIGSLIFMNRSPQNQGGFLIAGTISFVTAIVFVFLIFLSRDDR